MYNKFIGKGIVLTQPKLYYSHDNTDYYIFELGILRNSNYEDRINIVSKEKELEINNYVEVQGRFCSYNKKREDGTSKLFLYVKADYISWIGFEENLNKIEVDGYIVKAPCYRVTPLGREICDIIIACNNENTKKSEYLPVIIWDKFAKIAAEMQIGDKITVAGRIQSRIYTKNNENKIAYEISAKSFTKGLSN